MKFIFGEKLTMSQIFDNEGKVVPVTLIKVRPVFVTQLKTKENDGYAAVQVGFDFKKIKNIKKPQLGRLEKLKIFPKGENEKLKNFYPRHFGELRIDETETKYRLGDEIDVSVFEEGDIVNVTSIAKGKGFQGVVKRHGFAGGSRTHGQKHSEREPGSIGSVWPQRIIKGKRMPGRMGGKTVTVRNLKIVKIDKENNTLAIKGAIAGRRGTLVRLISKK